MNQTANHFKLVASEPVLILESIRGQSPYALGQNQHRLFDYVDSVAL